MGGSIDSANPHGSHAVLAPGAAAPLLLATSRDDNDTATTVAHWQALLVLLALLVAQAAEGATAANGVSDATQRGKLPSAPAGISKPITHYFGKTGASSAVAEGASKSGANGAANPHREASPAGPVFARPHTGVSPAQPCPIAVLLPMGPLDRASQNPRQHELFVGGGTEEREVLPHLTLRERTDAAAERVVDPARAGDVPRLVRYDRDGTEHVSEYASRNQVPIDWRSTVAVMLVRGEPHLPSARVFAAGLLQVDPAGGAVEAAPGAAAPATASSAPAAASEEPAVPDLAAPAGAADPAPPADAAADPAPPAAAEAAAEAAAPAHLEFDPGAGHLNAHGYDLTLGYRDGPGGIAPDILLLPGPEYRGNGPVPAAAEWVAYDIMDAGQFIPGAGLDGATVGNGCLALALLHLLLAQGGTAAVPAAADMYRRIDAIVEEIGFHRDALQQVVEEEQPYLLPDRRPWAVGTAGMAENEEVIAATRLLERPIVVVDAQEVADLNGAPAQVNTFGEDYPGAPLMLLRWNNHFYALTPAAQQPAAIANSVARVPINDADLTAALAVANARLPSRSPVPQVSSVSRPCKRRRGSAAATSAASAAVPTHHLTCPLSSPPAACVPLSAAGRWLY